MQQIQILEYLKHNSSTITRRTIGFLPAIFFFSLRPGERVVGAFLRSLRHILIVTHAYLFGFDSHCHLTARAPGRVSGVVRHFDGFPDAERGDAFFGGVVDHGGLFRHYFVYFRQQSLKCGVHPGRVERRSLNEGQIVSFAERNGLFGAHRPQVPQIGLVPDEHHHNILRRVLTQLPEPPLHVLERAVLRYVVYEQSADGTSVVGGRDGAVAFLARSVPYLGLYGFAFRRYGLGGELDACACGNVSGAESA